MKHALTLTAVLEASTGLGLLLLPALVGELLFGVELSGVSIVVARVTGIALIALGFACLPGRTPLGGMLTYSVLVTAYLTLVGFAGEFNGRLLWPAVALHVVLASLLVIAARTRKHTKDLISDT